MRRLSIMAWMSAALLAACGGGNTIVGSPTPIGTGTSGVSTVVVQASPDQIAADGSTTATISAYAKNSGNVAVSGVAVTFSATGGLLSVTQGTTDATGLATATLALAAGAAAAGSNITVTAAVPGATGKIVVPVVNIQQTIALTTSLPQIPSDGSKSATITAVVTNASNQLVSGVAVNFTTSSGALAVTQGTTNASGSATATLSWGNDPSNRIITVTATAGSASATVPVSVAGTTLTLAGPQTLVLSAQGTYTVALTNSSGAAIPGKAVTLASASGNTLTPATVTTDATGHGSFTLTAVKSGADTITATALNGTSVATETIQVSAQSFQFTTPAASSSATDVNLGTTQPLTVTYTVSGAPQAAQTVTFSSTRGTLSAATAVTNASGQASVSISSAVAGPATVTASVTTGTGASAQTLTTQQTFDFIATVPAGIDLQASPATIATQAQSTITAIVRDANNNLVENATVDFQTVNDTTGGALSVASAQTDSQGRAQTVYTASTTPSATNGVVVQATVQGTAVTATTDLTVGGITVFLSLGTGNKISENAAQTQFIQPYTVIALDTAGNPVANEPITLTVHALTYGKGYYTAGTSAWIQSVLATCPNEDDPTEAAAKSEDFNGVYTPGKDGIPPTTAVDYNPFGNQNGKLEPGGTAVASPSTVTTDSTGSGAFNVIYPEDQANWVQVELIASATVSGTETTATATFYLPILASYLTNLQSSPPGQISPYGQANVCTNPN